MHDCCLCYKVANLHLRAEGGLLRTGGVRKSILSRSLKRRKRR
jgi:hypothetical protein